MATRKQLQEKRNKAVVAQRQAKVKAQAKSAKGDDSGWAAVRKAAATTKALGDKMREAVKAKDTSKADYAITTKNVDEYVKSDGTLKKKTSVAPTASGRVKAGAAAPAGGDGSVMSIPSTFARTRMGYDPDTSVDMTNTNPAYWNSAIAYFKANPDGNPKTGELGIWIPNFEKQGAESVALAFIAGGGTAHVNSNYANNTVSDVRGARATDGAPGTRRATESLTGPGSESYRGGAEKAIRLNSISRGGTDVDTGRPMGGTDPIGYGAHILGGRVVKGAMPGYLKDGGDFGGLLGVGTSITGSMLTGLLGGMDKDGMRLRGTMPSVMGATGSGVGAGGTATSIGSLYGRGGGISGGGPVVPTFMSDWSKFMPKDFSLGEAMYDTSGREVAPGGFLYQPHTADYLGGMSVPGGGGLLGRSPPVTYTPPAVTYTPPAGVIPDPARLVSSPEVLGPRPSAEGEASMLATRGPLTGLLEGYGVPTMTGTWPGDAVSAMDAEVAAESEAVAAASAAEHFGDDPAPG